MSVLTRFCLYKYVAGWRFHSANNVNLSNEWMNRTMDGAWTARLVFLELGGDRAMFTTCTD